MIRQCSKPVMVSSLAYNMTGKEESEYTSEERNIYSALRQFSEDMESDLRLLGNFDEVKALFEEVVVEKEHILEMKARSFIPNAQEELKNVLLSYLDKTNKRVQVLERNDREQLLEQKKLVESQIGNIRADVAAVFGELNAKLQSEKAEGARELRAESKEFLNIKERTGSVTRTGTYTTGHFLWKKTHVYHYEEHYSYYIAADAIENLKKYAIDASNQVEQVFSEALQLKELKRKLLNVVVNNFDMGSEKYDSSLFRIMVEETVSSIEFPVFHIDISDAMDGIAGKFTGELTSADEKNDLLNMLSKAVSRICDTLCKSLESTVQSFRKEMEVIGDKVEDSLLANISGEFELLLNQCENKEKEIADYKEYVAILQKELAKI